MKLHIIESNFAGVRFIAAVCLGSFRKSSITGERVFDEEHTCATFEGLSDTGVRAQAQAYIDAQPKQKRAKRALSEGRLESLEAARNERDYL